MTQVSSKQILFKMCVYKTLDYQNPFTFTFTLWSRIIPIGAEAQ